MPQGVQQALVEAVAAAGGGGGGGDSGVGGAGSAAVAGEVAVVTGNLQAMMSRRQRWLATSRERLAAIAQV